MRRVAILCGGRNFSPPPEEARWYRETLVLALRRIQISMAIHGDAAGADRWMAEVAGSELAITVQSFPPAYDLHGDLAPVIRNSEMADFPDVVACIAFPGGEGTKDMVAKARRKKIRVLPIDLAQGQIEMFVWP